MKNILRGITFWTIVIAFILIMFSIANILSNLITMDLVMTAVYVSLGLGFIYLIRN